MLTLSYILLAIASALPLDADPFLEAQQAFLRELNSMDGIELAGGPFHASEQHHFEGESGYFVLAPAFTIPTLDQRLTVQTRAIHLSTAPAPAATNTLPIATSDYPRDQQLSAADRQQIHTLLTRHGFAARRDEITALDLHTIQIRPVLHLPILKIAATSASTDKSSPASNHLPLTPNNLPLTTTLLLGAQPWQGIPLYRATFDRIRGDFELETLRVNFISRSRHEVPHRPPILTPQTFFSEPGLDRDDWRKILRNFATLELPAVEILEATVSDRLVNLYADCAKPVLPKQWVKLERQNGRWKITQAVEFRAEFPRPSAMWTFLPLLPAQATPAPHLLQNSEIPVKTQRDLASLISRLRGVGQLTEVSTINDTVRARTAHHPWRGYDLTFAELDNRWRLTSVGEWTE